MARCRGSQDPACAPRPRWPCVPLCCYATGAPSREPEQDPARWCSLETVATRPASVLVGPILTTERLRKLSTLLSANEYYSSSNKYLQSRKN